MTLHFMNNQHSICPMIAFILSRYKWTFCIDRKKINWNPRGQSPVPEPTAAEAVNYSVNKELLEGKKKKKTTPAEMLLDHHNIERKEGNYEVKSLSASPPHRC